MKTGQPTPVNTKQGFTAARTLGQQKMDALNTAIAAERADRRKLNDMLTELYQDCLDWYNDACLMFKEDTPEGLLIRGILRRVSTKPDDETEGGEDGVPEK